MKAFSKCVMSGMICLSMGAAACSGAEGECTYDTDCPEACMVCDPTVHRCVMDMACDAMRRGECITDLDCDPINEKCEKDPGAEKGKCVPRLDGGTQPSDPGGGDPGQQVDNPVCQNPDLDCSAPGLPGQGNDRDGDEWGECCDCNDLDDQVYPGRSELIYNCKDDDCDPATPDGDLDGDGFIAMQRFCEPGPDCDDRDASVYPGAPENCDGKDNDCDGPIDEDCTTSDGGQTDGGGGDPGAECPNLAGSYHIEANCMAIDDADAEITQEGCEISLNFSGIGCTGTVDAGMNLHIECAGIPVACSAKVSLTSGFLVMCSEDCTFYFTPIDEGTPCTYHNEPACTQNGKLCGVVGQDGIPQTKCVATLPEGRQPGYYCDPAWDINCINSLCITSDDYCAAICETQAHCDPFPGMTCQTILYDDGHDTVGEITACAPEFQGETRCGRTTECSMSRVCSYRATDDDVITVCRTPNPGGAAHGEPCTQNSVCENNLCVCGDHLCEGEQGTCSEVCVSGSDCLQGYTCGAVSIDDLQGTEHLIHACIRDTSSCGRDADCPSGKCCQIFVSQDGQSLETLCYWGGGEGEPNTGEDCINGNECCSVYCYDFPSYCMGLCIGDGDCPSWEAGACSGDDDCELGYLCDSDTSTCTRAFECTTIPVILGYDMFGEPIIDTANVCMPKRRTCRLNEECRDGEACKLYNNKNATAAQFQCEVGGPGTAASGESCYPGGADACWTGLCLLYNEGGEGLQYCSKPCLTDQDCGDPTEHYCATLQVDVRPGFVSYVPVCALRNP